MDYPFIIAVRDGYVTVADDNQVGPHSGNEIAGTYYMTEQYHAPGWIRNS